MEYLVTNQGERIPIPDVVVSESNGRELVAQYCAASESGRAALVAQCNAAIAQRENRRDAPTAPTAPPAEQPDDSTE